MDALKESVALAFVQKSKRSLVRLRPTIQFELPEEKDRLVINISTLRFHQGKALPYLPLISTFLEAV